MRLECLTVGGFIFDAVVTGSDVFDDPMNAETSNFRTEDGTLFEPSAEDEEKAELHAIEVYFERISEVD